MQRASLLARTTLPVLLACTLLAGCQSTATPQSAATPAQVRSVTSSTATPSIPATDGSESATSPAGRTATIGVAGQVASSTPATAQVAPLLPPIAKLPAPKPARTLTGPSDRGVPILMYHVIGVAPAGARNPDLYVPPKEFADEMAYLSANGYHAVTLQQVWDYWNGTNTLPSKPVVISFDDGDTPDFTIAAPLLNELHWPGTLNLIVGKKHLRFKPKIVRALIAAGWEIDSHTMTHTDVPGLSAKQLTYEIAGSRKRLQELYGVPVNFFCYPSGRFDDNAIAAVKAAGYLGATTTLGGLARPDDPWRMRRVRVSGGHSPASFGALLGEAR